MLGVSNAIACGMMLSASWSLVAEGASLADEPECALPSALLRALAGVALGLAFILPAKRILDRHEVGGRYA
jgi:hypothetical protein